jgi:hypothetical protein
MLSLRRWPCAPACAAATGWCVCWEPAWAAAAHHQHSSPIHHPPQLAQQQLAAPAIPAVPTARWRLCPVQVLWTSLPFSLSCRLMWQQMTPHVALPLVRGSSHSSSGRSSWSWLRGATWRSASTTPANAASATWRWVSSPHHYGGGGGAAAAAAVINALCFRGWLHCK